MESNLKRKSNKKTMSPYEAERLIRSPSTPSPKKRGPRLSDLWLKSPKSFNNMIFAMKLHSLPNSKLNKTLTPGLSTIDKTSLFPDSVLLDILSKTPASQRNSNFLVCKRWLNLQGRLVRSLKVLDWSFLESGRITTRFPNLTHVDLVLDCVVCPKKSEIAVSYRENSVYIGSEFSPEWRMIEQNLLSSDVIDRGLRVIAEGCPNLRKLAVMNASELGVLSLAEECSTLQELELHRCGDNVLRGIAACENLQILRLVGKVDGFYESLVSDVGLTILAQGCQRLVKLELSGCGGSFEGIKAIGQCCHMLEELIICSHRMESGWLSALQYCENLKTLKIQSCRSIDPCPDPGEYLGFCPSLERLHLQKCRLQDKKSVKAMFIVCKEAREISIQDCWGLDNDIFSFASACRRVRFLSLEGCPLLTTQGLESVGLFWSDLQSLRVVSCKNIKDSEVSPALSTLLSNLKDFKWRPDSRSLLSSNLGGTGMGKRGGKFFKKTLNLRSLPDDYNLHFDFIHR